jgi:hypothetical protein
MAYKETLTDQMVVNKLTRAQYDTALSAGEISDTELYLVTDDEDAVPNSALMAEVGRNHWNGKIVYASGDTLTLTDTLAPYYTSAVNYLTMIDVRKFYYPDERVGSDFRLVLPDFGQECGFTNFASHCRLFNGVLVLGDMQVSNWTLEMPFAHSTFSAIELGEGKSMRFVNASHKEIWNPFYNCPNLTRIGTSSNPFDFTGVTLSGNLFTTSTKLKEIYIKGIGNSFRINTSTAFEEADLVNILNNLAIVTDTQTLTMGATNLAKLSDSEKEIATKKGWVLA